MKLAGFLLLPAGWVIVIAAVLLLGAAAPRTLFVLAGIAVETLGAVLAFHSHLVIKEERR